ncbi:unnamed protein product, partial [Ectocarpus sp. 4 AP-2014]
IRALWAEICLVEQLRRYSTSGANSVAVFGKQGLRVCPVRTDLPWTRLGEHARLYSSLHTCEPHRSRGSQPKECQTLPRSLG